MLTVSLHNIKLHAPVGLYPEEKILGNDFEIDVDVFLPIINEQALPFVDYTLIQNIVHNTFKQGGQLLETLAENIYTTIKINVPIAEKIKVAIRKLNPPLPGEVKYAQVVYEM
jgi:dihydroneopterin aldolase